MDEKIKQYFDKLSVNRNIRTESCPILKYEQEMRQRAVVELLNLKKDDLILEVGCGNARDVLVFAMKGVKCIGIDFSCGMIKEGKKDIDKIGLENIDLFVGSGTNLPFKDESFDKISCSEVIEHIPNYEDAIAEMSRVLNRGGELVITTPNWHSLYGITRKLLDFVGYVLRKKNTYAHPYDEWKTQKEVINVLEKHGVVINKKIGICFIPGHLTYFLPTKFKEIVVRLSFSIENKFRNSLTGKGYNIGVSATKK